MIKNIQHLLEYFNVGVTRKSNLDDLRSNAHCAQDIALLKMIAPEYRSQCVDYFAFSESQIRQDLFVLAELGFKRDGFFVEFGATNGIDVSNSYLLEKKFGWDGILAEPARMWHAKLAENRSASIETKCVWKSSGDTLSFNETKNGDLSTLEAYSARDMHSQRRVSGKRYDVDTISLTDLLDKYDAPKTIDYLSIDTEGSEYEILKTFDFSLYKFRVITCEHNFTPMREHIYKLLTGNGYTRKFSEISQFDDWYILD
jgi:FkbM family methyltransferase